ncbi:MAG: hypothetical protein JO333_17795 [Verrucomicrobia bacterium]|nr:hypothetical protein [Verrucomicrobiota bacterium]
MGRQRVDGFKDRYFLIIARFVEKKNLFSALGAYRNYAQLLGVEASPLHLAGCGPLEPKIRDYIRTHDLKNVVLHGFVNEVQLAQILKGATYVVE